MPVSGETRLRNRGVCGVARQVHHQRRGRVGKQRVHVGVDRRLAIVGGERGRAVAVAVTHRGQSQAGVGQPACVLTSDSPGPDERTLHTTQYHY